jgi:hypothetical protein
MRARRPTERPVRAVSKTTPWWEWVLLFASSLINLLGVFVAEIKELLALFLFPALIVD